MPGFSQSSRLDNMNAAPQSRRRLSSASSWGKVWEGAVNGVVRREVALYRYLLGSEHWITRFGMEPMPPRAGGATPRRIREEFAPPTAGQGVAGMGLKSSTGGLELERAPRLYARCGSSGMGIARPRS